VKQSWLQDCHGRWLALSTHQQYTLAAAARLGLLGGPAVLGGALLPAGQAALSMQTKLVPCTHPLTKSGCLDICNAWYVPF
jgi:hypothetical protein